MKRPAGPLLAAVLAWTAAVTAFTMLLSLFSYLAVFSRQERAAFEEKTRAAVRQLEAGLILPVWNLDAETAERLLENVLRDEDFVAVRLETPDGLFPPMEVRSGAARGQVRSGAVVYDTTYIAGFDLEIDDSRMRRRVAGLGFLFGLITVASELFLAGTLTLLLARNVLKPLRKLKEYAAGVAAAASPGGEVPAAEGTRRRETEVVEASVRAMVALLERRYADLGEAQQELRRSLSEKEVLLRELHHRVKNNLGILNSLLQLQLERFGNPEVDQMIRGLQNRIQAIADLHRRLYRADDLRAVDFASYLRDVAENVALSFGHAGPDGRIRLETRLAETAVDFDTAHACGLVVNELLTNAYRHAFPGDRSGRILLETRERGGETTIIVEDDGVGIEGAGAGGLGMVLVESLVEQLGGSLTRESRDGSGTSFALTFMIDRRASWER